MCFSGHDVDHLGSRESHDVIHVTIVLVAYGFPRVVNLGQQYLVRLLRYCVWKMAIGLAVYGFV